MQHCAQVVNKRRRQARKEKVITRPLTAYSTHRRCLNSSEHTRSVRFRFILPSLHVAITGSNQNQVQANAVQQTKEKEPKNKNFHRQNQRDSSQIHFRTGNSTICGPFSARLVARAPQCRWHKRGHRQSIKKRKNEKNEKKTVGGGRGGAALYNMVQHGVQHLHAYSTQ